jgi:hypothetical protein
MVDFGAGRRHHICNLDCGDMLAENETSQWTVGSEHTEEKVLDMEGAEIIRRTSREGRLCKWTLSQGSS